MILNVLLVDRKVEDWRCLNLTCVAADTRDECHQVSRVENRAAGHVKDSRGTECLYSQQAGLGQIGRAPTSQMSMCQTKPRIPEGVFQWYCYPRRDSKGRRREWVSAKWATLYSHTAASLWVSHISWDHFQTTVQLTAFDHRGACIWFFFSCAIFYAEYWFYDQALK